MEIVTLAHVTLNRVGSATHRGIVSHKEASATRQVPDSSLESLVELVKSFAAENGEARDKLTALAPPRDRWRFSPPKDTMVFDVEMPNVQYSTPYATCSYFTALKAEDRYFKLEEVKV